MKIKNICLALSLLLMMVANAQQQRFDITSYTPPKNWSTQKSAKSVQFTKQDEKAGTYAIITLMQAVPGTDNGKENFDAAWESVVQEMVKVEGKPQMQAPVTDNGWEAQSGYAAFSAEGLNGIALLVTTSGFGKMVNILVLTNTDVYQDEISAFLGSASFTKPEAPRNNTNTNTNTNTNKNNNTNAGTKPAGGKGYAFTTTNFDDGWTSTVQEDWVEVTKGELKVLLHYPKEGTIFPADPEPLTNAAWNILVAPRYSNLKNYRTAYISTYNRPYLGMGTATSNATGKQVYLVFFRQGSSGWIEFICPDKNSFVRQYGFDPETIRWDSNEELMNALSRMANYNKFAVAASDFKGTWTSDFTGIQQLYSVYTGNYAGMQVHQSNQTFVFGANNSYNWSILAVNGMVGSMKYDNAKSSGKFTVLNNWQVQFSSIEGKPKKYDAYFSCIKGARVLWLQDAVYKGGGYTAFGLK